MIVVTGGAGFIGSALVWRLNQMGYENIMVVDELGTSEKWRNLAPLKFDDYFHKRDFLEMVERDKLPFTVRAVLHMGANSSTTERDVDHLVENNYRYTQKLAMYALRRNVRFIYASSAATYGDGSLGFEDRDELSLDLAPLNPYGFSKNVFDRWAYARKMFGEIVGLKFFNVFGPNEGHKGDMRSVVVKSYEQIKATGSVKLFKSYREGYADGEQKRDFLYVKDAVDIALYFLFNRESGGLFNVGSGAARTWLDLVGGVFSALGKEPNVEFVDMPEELREKYQYFTEAELTKLRRVGCDYQPRPLEDAVADYVTNYLEPGRRLGEED
jgi:ADP-L-glycero-D-manno-heptose 6-epimerase